MLLKYKPCAYCGTSDVQRTKGHVIPSSLFSLAHHEVQRITVPECIKCKNLWEDAEPHFRNVMSAIWDSEQVVKDRRFQNMVRSFFKLDGKRRLMDLLSQFVPIQTSTGEREMVFPSKDPLCNLIFRRIVRGLSYHQNLGFPIADKQVITNSMIYEVPDEFKKQIIWHELAPDFFRYGYSIINEHGLHSFWLMRFSKHIELFGLISSKES